MLRDYCKKKDSLSLCNRMRFTYTFIYIHIDFVFTYTFFSVSISHLPQSAYWISLEAGGAQERENSASPVCVPLCPLTWHLWMQTCLTSVNEGVTPRSGTHFHLAIPQARARRWTCYYHLPVFSQSEFCRVQWWVLWFPRLRHVSASFSLQNSAHFQIPWKGAGMRKRNTQCLTSGQKRRLPHNTSRSGKLPQHATHLWIHLNRVVGGEETIETVLLWFWECGPLSSKSSITWMGIPTLSLIKLSGLGQFSEPQFP